MDVTKDIRITFDTTKDRRELVILRKLVSLGLTGLNDVDKESWGKHLEECQKWGRKFMEDTAIVERT